PKPLKSVAAGLAPRSARRASSAAHQPRNTRKQARRSKLIRSALNPHSVIRSIRCPNSNPRRHSLSSRHSAALTVLRPPCCRRVLLSTQRRRLFPRIKQMNERTSAAQALFPHLRQGTPESAQRQQPASVAAAVFPNLKRAPQPKPPPHPLLPRLK